MLQAYRRCAHALRTATGPRALFLKCYATYIAGERLREQTRAEADRDATAASTSNQVRQFTKSPRLLAAVPAGLLNTGNMSG